MPQCVPPCWQFEIYAVTGVKQVKRALDSRHFSRFDNCCDTNLDDSTTSRYTIFSLTLNSFAATYLTSTFRILVDAHTQSQISHDVAFNYTRAMLVCVTLAPPHYTLGHLPSNSQSTISSITARNLVLCSGTCVAKLIAARRAKQCVVRRRSTASRHLPPPHPRYRHAFVARSRCFVSGAAGLNVCSVRCARRQRRSTRRREFAAVVFVSTRRHFTDGSWYVVCVHSIL
jgi:hypothetical protein